jgi:hypothetical protein
MNIWGRMPVWARIICVLLVFVVIALLPSLGPFLQRVLIFGFVIGVFWAIVQAIARALDRREGSGD